ncbi:MAG: hypothetical protein V3S50_01325 [Acidobacteriota bacterium]
MKRNKGLKSFWVLFFLLLVCPKPFVNAQTATFEVSGAVGGFFPTLLEPERYMGIAFTNTTDFEVSIELRAFDPHGDLITGIDILNPATLRVPPRGQTWAAVGDVFGSSILSAGLGKISYQSNRAALATLFLIGDEKNTLLDGGTAGQTPLKTFVLPSISREGEMPFTTVHVSNPSADSTLEVELTLYDSAGIVVASRSVALPPQGTVVRNVTALFGIDPAMFSGGYIRGSAGGDGVVAFETFGNEQSLNLLSAQPLFPSGRSYSIPHFAVGGGFDTELNLINTDSSRGVTLRIVVLDDQGNARLNPVQVSLGPLEQGVFHLSSLLGISSNEQIVGSLRIDLEEGFDSSLDPASVNGSLRLKSSDGRLSASLPLLLPRDADAFYAHIAQDLGFFTGVAVVNPHRNPVEVRVEAFDQVGDPLGENTFTLPGGGRKAKLLMELIPATAGQVGGYFRVRGAREIVSFALFGDLASESISIIPSQ